MSQIKELDKEIKELEQANESMELERRKLAEQKERNKRKIKELSDRRSKILSPPPLSVTDHALLRFLERVIGLDVEAYRRTILNAETQRIAATIGGGKFSQEYEGKKYRILIRGNKIITVLNSESSNVR